MSGADAVDGWIEAIRAFGDRWPAQGAEVVAEAIRHQVMLDTGGDGHLSNYVGESISVLVEGQEREAVIIADGSRGQWSILENGTDAHDIYPRAGRYLMTPMGPRRMVHVQGVHAKQTWTIGLDVGMTEAEKDAERAWGEVGNA